MNNHQFEIDNLFIEYISNLIDRYVQYQTEPDYGFENNSFFNDEIVDVGTPVIWDQVPVESNISESNNNINDEQIEDDEGPIEQDPYRVLIPEYMNIPPLTLRRSTIFDRVDLNSPHSVGLQRSSMRIFKDEDYNLATIYFNHLRDEWIELHKERLDGFNYDNYIQFPLSKTLNILLNYFFDNGEAFPDTDQFIDEIYKNICICVNRYAVNYSYIQNTNIIKDVFRDFIILYGYFPSCNYIDHYIQFFIMHKRIPTIDELNEYLRRLHEFSNSPEDFHQKDKQFVPTIGINKLPTYEFSLIPKENILNDCCAICRDDFQQSTKVIQLTPCNHLFHSNCSECLEEASIINWLNNHNFCPLCKSKISLTN